MGVRNVLNKSPESSLRPSTGNFHWQFGELTQDKGYRPAVAYSIRLTNDQKKLEILHQDLFRVKNRLETLEYKFSQLQPTEAQKKTQAF